MNDSSRLSTDRGAGGGACQWDHHASSSILSSGPLHLSGISPEAAVFQVFERDGEIWKIVAHASSRSVLAAQMK